MTRSPLTFRRPLVRVAMVSLACASLVWALWLVVFGGFDVTLLGVRIRSRDPRRLVMLAGLASIGFFLAGGTIPLTALVTRVRAWPAALARRPGSIALGLAALSVLVAVVGGTRIAGGSDAYGYVSQADLWLQGNLESAPALGRTGAVAETRSGRSRRSATGRSSATASGRSCRPIRPVCRCCWAGQGVGGQCVCSRRPAPRRADGARHVRSRAPARSPPTAALSRAWLVATSPITLSSSLEPLTDVPVMAMWSLAFFFVLAGVRRSAAAAGVFAALAILIRPNLCPARRAAGGLVPRPPRCPRSAGRNPPASGWFCGGIFAAHALLGVGGGRARSISISMDRRRLRAMDGSRIRWRWRACSRTSNAIPRGSSRRTRPSRCSAWSRWSLPLRRFWPGVADRRVFAVSAASSCCSGADTSRISSSTRGATCASCFRAGR